MNVGELRKLLEQYPDDLEVIHDMHSDYVSIEAGDWSIVMAVDQGHYIMQSHPTMSGENKSREKAYLHLVGN